jgi:hypothetical protein
MSTYLILSYPVLEQLYSTCHSTYVQEHTISIKHKYISYSSTCNADGIDVIDFSTSSKLGVFDCLSIVLHHAFFYQQQLGECIHDDNVCHGFILYGGSAHGA